MNGCRGTRESASVSAYTLFLLLYLQIKYATRSNQAKKDKKDPMVANNVKSPSVFIAETQTFIPPVTTMKRFIPLLLTLVLAVSSLGSVAQVNYNVWVTSEGSGMQISNGPTHRHHHHRPAPPRRHHRHHRHYRPAPPRHHHMSKKQMKKMKKMHKKQMKRHNKHHHHHH